MRILDIIKKTIATFNKISEENNNRPKYRVIEIFKDKDDNYKTMLQVVNKNVTFYAKPEEILADDDLVDCLSPRDVRTLTYLGYLSINQPQYKILAQRFSEQSDLFIIKERGVKKPIVKTVAEIHASNMATQMDAKDAKIVGYAVATNEINQEKLEKEAIKLELESK